MLSLVQLETMERYKRNRNGNLKEEEGNRMESDRWKQDSSLYTILFFDFRTM